MDLGAPPPCTRKQNNNILLLLLPPSAEPGARAPFDPLVAVLVSVAHMYQLTIQLIMHTLANFEIG